MLPGFRNPTFFRLSQTISSRWRLSSLHAKSHMDSFNLDTSNITICVKLLYSPQIYDCCSQKMTSVVLTHRLETENMKQQTSCLEHSLQHGERHPEYFLQANVSWHRSTFTDLQMAYYYPRVFQSQIIGFPRAHYMMLFTIVCYMGLKLGSFWELLNHARRWFAAYSECHMTESSSNSQCVSSFSV